MHPGSGNQGSADGAVTLRVSTWGNDSRLRLTQEAVDAFKAANPGIDVVVENSEWTAYWDKLATSHRGQRLARRDPDGRGLHRRVRLPHVP